MDDADRTEQLRRRFIIGGVGCMSSPLWGCLLLVLGIVVMSYIGNTPLYSDWVWTFMGKTEMIASSFDMATADAPSPTGRYIMYGGFHEGVPDVRLLDMDADRYYELPTDIEQSFWLNDTVIAGVRRKAGRAVELRNAETGSLVPFEVRSTIFFTDTARLNAVRAELQGANTVYRSPEILNGAPVAYIIAELQGKLVGYPSYDVRAVDAVLGDSDYVHLEVESFGKRESWSGRIVSPNGQYFLDPTWRYVLISNAYHIPLAFAVKPDASLRPLGWADDGRSVYFVSNTGTLHYPAFKLSVVNPAVQLWYWFWPVSGFFVIRWLYRRKRRQSRQS